LETARTFIEGSGLSDDMKTTMLGLLEKAESNPLLANTILEQIKSTLGL